MVESKEFRANYQDHVHVPSKQVTARINIMRGVSRAGVSVLDPVSFVGSNVFDSTKNLIEGNVIVNSLVDGIHIQGDLNTIIDNTIVNNTRYGIYLCGEGLGGCCHFPGEEADSESNTVSGKVFKNNRQDDIGDFGIGNIVN